MIKINVCICNFLFFKDFFIFVFSINKLCLREWIGFFLLLYVFKYVKLLLILFDICIYDYFF